MTPLERKILPPDALRDVREKHRLAGDVVVQCHGCFDIVHPGHIRYLQFAKEQGDVLIVSLTAEGRRAFRAMARTHEDWIAEIFGDLSADEVDQLMRLLARTKGSARKALTGDTE